MMKTHRCPKDSSQNVSPKSYAAQQRDAGQKSIPRPSVLITENSSTGNPNVSHYLQYRTVTCYAVTKSMNIFDTDMDGLGCQFITVGDEDKSDESQTQAHRSLRIDDHADDQKEIQLQTQKTKI